VLGFSPLRAGLAFLPFIAGVVVAANFVSNKGLDRFGPKIVVPAGMILAAGAAAWLTGLGVHGGYGTRVAPALVLIGLGTGAIVAPARSSPRCSTRAGLTGPEPSCSAGGDEAGFVGDHDELGAVVGG
jgi:hypothetical protein